MTRAPRSSQSFDDTSSPEAERTGGWRADSEQDAAEALFRAALARLERTVSLFVYRGFLAPLVPLRLDDELLTLVAPSTFHRDWVRDHYAEALEKVLSSVSGKKTFVTVIFDARLVDPETRAAAEAAAAQMPAGEPLPEASPLAGPAPAAPPARPGPAPVVSMRQRKADPNRPPPRLHRNYTFDRFIRGQSNQMALAACQAVAEHPASQYSPLFLFGGTGLGKTHLLQAIGNAVGLRVVYMSAEEWVNEYISDIRRQRWDDFRRRYRSGCDILLLDDIQFLAGKDSSQDEFFHTFNSLYAAGRQIVVTSDRYPHEIEGLEERLKTRLQWGLIADVQPPEMETRIAIAQAKADAIGMPLPSDVANWLAAHFSRSVRELEGALVRLHAWVSLAGVPLTLETARDQLRGVVGRAADTLSLESIIKAVSAYYDLKPQDLRSKSRQRQLVRARHVAMYLGRKHLGASLPEIGRAFGGRDHTTVLASVRKVEGLLTSDAGVQAVISRLEKMLLER
jgi:chromosomal replication initiator protein